MDNVVTCADGLLRCRWSGIERDEQYQRYHDQEWGRPVSGERELFERLSLEAFQSGLSWITILRKREALRAAFAHFEPEVVAEFTSTDVDRLMADAGIVRNLKKINATIANAQAILALPQDVSLSSLVYSFPSPTPRSPELAVPSKTAESTALAKTLKEYGFAFVGPTTAYAMMQAVGIVNDHQLGCWVRAGLLTHPTTVQPRVELM